MISFFRELDPYTLVNQTKQIAIQNILKLDIYGAAEPFRFVLDGKEFSENPVQFVKNGGLFGNKPVIIGTTPDEMIDIPLLIPDALNVTFKRFEVRAIITSSLNKRL